MLGLVAKGASKTPRMALDALKFLFKGQTSPEIALRIAPDVLFGVLEGTMTPGDIGDKLIAGGGSALGSTVGGLTLGKLAGRNQLAGIALDTAGSLGGDFAGRAGADLILRGKDKLAGGEGLTPYENLGERQRQELTEQVQTQLLAELGLLPSSTQQYLVNPNIG
tara:strand:+ start:1592 stop:2086 length:495 start_codon:yes stop_codon:yes gene_type:complete